MKTQLLLEPAPHFSLIGHRGAPMLAPENTLESFKKAAELGLNWVELDTRRCATGEWVVIHDQDLERCTNGHGLVELTPYHSLKNLDAGSWFNPKFQSERIPLLSETLLLLANLGLQPNIDIKFPKDHEAVDDAIVDSLLRIVAEFWPKTKPLPLLSSFRKEFLIKLKNNHLKNHNLPLGFIVKHFTDDALNFVLEQKLQSLHCHYQHIDLQQIKTVIAAGVPLLLFTVNDANLAQSLLAEGVTAIFSDDANLLKDKNSNLVLKSNLK